MAKEEKVQPEQNEALRGILDPIAPEDLTEHGQNVSGWLDPMRDLNPEYLANMDYNKEIHWGNQSFNQYWDDSSPEKQWTLGWMNEKYTWANTKNSDINYNPDITTKDLNPNFVYGQTSKVYGTDHPWYISQRNDDIASALYNEWRVSKEEVQKFLEGQTWFFNSSEADRANTVESVWKRLWAIAEQNKQEEEPDLSKAEEIEKDYSWKIYWKTTAEEWEPKEWINTLADKNSVYSIMEAWRIARLKALVSMNPKDIAVAELSWIMPEWEQANRDLQQYYPEVYKQVQEEKKKIIAQENTSAIASGWEMTTAADKVNTNTELTSFAVNNATSSTSATELLKGIDSILESNDTAKSAEELMWSIEKDMATLKNRLKNLKQEASSVFKWDVPQYLVNAYINNKTQEIQNQMSILEDRYNAAYSRYKTEVANAQWEKEYELKERQVKIQEDAQTLNEWKAMNWVTWTSSSWTWSAKMRTERNNNPTAMTTDVAKMLGWELGVDYEVWDAFVTASWQTLYTAKLIGDPIETTIRLIDRWIANGIDPFYRANWQPRWTYISKIWITKEKWQQMSPAEKADVIAKMLKYEWWSMENMLYYVEQNKENGWDNVEFDETYSEVYDKYLSWDYSKAWLEAQTTAMWITAQELDSQAKAYKIAQDEKIAEEAKNKPAKWKRKDGAEFDMSDTPTFDTLTYDQKNIVYQLLNLNKNPATITKRQYWDDFEKILSAVKEINPNWSDADFWQSDKVKKEWNTSSKNGSNSRNWTAIATAMDIYELADEYGNMKWKDWNDMLNKLKGKLSDEAYTKLLINLEVLASEYAWALKGNNAAPTEQEIEDKKEILAANLWAWAMKEAAIQVARTLYNKNANEADNYFNATLQKPPLVVTKEVADWMYSVAGIKDLPNKYQYTPKGWLKPSKDDSTKTSTSTKTTSTNTTSTNTWGKKLDLNNLFGSTK